MATGTAHLNADEKRRFALASLGFALFYAVCVSFFYSTSLLGREGFDVQHFDNVLNPTMFVVAAIFSALAGRAAATRQKIFAYAGYVLLAAALCLALWHASAAPAASLFGIAAFCAGAGMSLTAPFFFASLAAFPRRLIALACGIMALLGMLLDIGWSLLPATFSLIAQLAVLGASAFCLKASTNISFARAPKSSESSPASTRMDARSFLNTFLVSGVGTFALSIAYGVIDIAASGAGSSVEFTTGISKFGGVFAAIAFTLYFAAAKQSSATMLFNVVFGFLAAAMLFLPFLPAAYAVALNSLIAAGWKLVMLSLFYLVVITFAHNRTRLLSSIALAYALPRFGLFLGMNIAIAFQIDGSADFVRTTAVAFFLLYIILMAAWLVNAHERRKALKEAKAAYEQLGRYAQNQGDLKKTRCQDLSAEYGLTDREAGILLLLAQGRDAAFISEHLFLSRNTVKSYQKSIYAKLGVHSKQEIIDLASSLPVR
ncbi:helix-turn-helix transcriptional regulator [Adlercreutzia shanghongiae]|uniref:LuxR C-terminal-related transcriptional regulator n=1 Tax=Adlercreutzia shanghongiae TaxID=3111773 RepID=A0ABU6J027_9ACTN|nr:LuxR C-terminal-related transcriptional regulator [Adlercreutzia sp. R22]MEC4295440.1 LuxR C-terminal-related transcriptional regulator [Adlercreutzia sp. R22]